MCSMETLQVTEIQKSESLEVLNRSEIDVQIATAKQWPRDVVTANKTIIGLATMDEETAAECFYALKRKGKDGKESVIEGPSVRLAEIIATSWGNLRVASRIIANDGKKLTAQGICMDLQNNVAVSSEVVRGIVTKEGRTYNDDMQTVTGNAACAIAFRNAVFKVIPKAIVNPAIKQIKSFLKSTVSQSNIAETIDKMIATFGAKGVTEKMLLAYLKIDSRDQITEDMIVHLRGVNTALAEGTITVKSVFVQPAEQAGNGTDKANTAKDKIAKALNKQEDFDDMPEEMFS